MASIHPTSIVDPAAELDDGVEIGPYSVVGPDVRIGARTRIGPHVVIAGHTSIGADNHVYQFCSIGGAPQDKKYAGEPTRLEIGDRNTIREFCTFNCGTVQDAGVTRIGNDNWIMAYVHLAHDCQVGSNTIFANNAQLAGHVSVGDWAILGGFTVVHQFVRIGAHCITGMGSILFQDVPPFVIAQGNPAKPFAPNNEGIRRRGFGPEFLRALKKAYKLLYRSGLSLDEARGKIDELARDNEALRVLSEFLAAPGRGIVR